LKFSKTTTMFDHVDHVPWFAPNWPSVDSSLRNAGMRDWTKHCAISCTVVRLFVYRIWWIYLRVVDSWTDNCDSVIDWLRNRLLTILVQSSGKTVRSFYWAFIYVCVIRSMFSPCTTDLIMVEFSMWVRFVTIFNPKSFFSYAVRFWAKLKACRYWFCCRIYFVTFQ
jgi:hypothetical protein